MEFYPFNMEAFPTFYIIEIKLLNKTEIRVLKWKKG